MGASPHDIATSPTAVIGRMTSGITSRQVEAQLNAAVASLPLPGANDRDRQPAQGVRLDSADSSLSNSRRGPLVAALAIVTGVIALLLVLGCVNVASLLLANGVARRRELGVRIALGASRARVVRQLLTESLSLGLLGGLAGFPAVPIAFGVSVLILVLSTMAAIIVPARRAAAVDPATVLRQV